MSSRLVIFLTSSGTLTYNNGFQITREGALNIVRQAVAAGITHASYVGTIGAVLDLASPLVKAPLSDKAWNPLTEESVLSSGNPVLVYTVAKTQAEQSLWKFADEHPELNLTTGTFWGLIDYSSEMVPLTDVLVSPSSFIGPYTEEFTITPGNVSDLSTSVMVYNFLGGPEASLNTLPIGHVDVRDVAAAMVGGIKVKGNHRLLLTGEWFDYADVVKHIAATRPELAPRLIKTTSAGQNRPMIDSKKALDVLGITLTPWKKTIDDGLDSVLKLEKDWAEKGVDLAPLKNNGWIEFVKSGANTRVEFTG